jgi:hypothetical protein
MERCKTCKHWAPLPDETLTLRGAGHCTAALPIWEATEEAGPEGQENWYNEDTRLRLKPACAGVLAVVEDGSQYMARLVTMPDFGCVQHEARE